MHRMIHRGQRRTSLPLAFTLAGFTASSALLLTNLPVSSRAASPAGGSAEERARQLRALVPVRGVLGRRIDPAPAGADALRVTVLGDGSGGRLQVRLLAPGEDGALTGYFAAPEVVLDFQGWKTLTLPLSTFTFHSDNNPEISRDGLGSVESLSNAVGVQIAVLSPATKVFLDDLAWAKADAPLALIDGFEDSGAASSWKPVGDFNERRAVDHSINKVAAYVKNGTGSLQFVIRSRGQTEQQLYEAALKARLSRVPTQPYAVYVRPPFEAITVDSTPAPAEVKPGIAPMVSLFSVPGETEPGTFAVYAALPMKGATVAVKVPLTSAKKAILPASAIDIHVIHGEAALENAPQVLIKDDREPLTGPLPKVRLTGAPVTNIAGGTSKQFWITVRVPRNQAPGMYTGKLAFSAPGIKPSLVTLSVEVLPLELKTAHFQYGIDVPSVLQAGDAPQPNERVVTPETYAAQLTDIRDHGFKVVALHGKPSVLAQELKIYKEVGLSQAGPVVIASPLSGSDEFTAVEGLRSSVGLLSTFEMYYQLPLDISRDTEGTRRYTENARSVNRNALVIAPIDASSTYGDLSKSGGEALAPIYALSSDYAQKVLTEGRRFTPNRDYWSWNISRESPSRNRLLAGFLLLKTGNGLYGAFPGPYQFIPGDADPFSLLHAPAEEAASSEAMTRPQMAAFSVEGGVLDTVQWEAIREGVDDVRYADLLKTLSRELKDLKYRKDATDYAESYLIGVLGKPLLTLSPREQQSYRRGIAEQCLKLKSILAKAPKSKD